MPKAIRVHEFGGPEVLRYEDVEIGDPGPGQVRIRQHAIGLNFIDIYMRTGLYAASIPSMPFTPGNEGAGEVVSVGANVTGLKPGDRVTYGTALGGYAQERLIPADKLVPLPDGISYETAAAMMLKGLTAQYLLRQTFRVGAGQTILVHAAAGGVGLILCQWGRALGATVIGTVGSPEKAEVAQKAGADHTILYRTEDFAAKVKDITKGKLCDVVYDGVGKATFPASLDCLRPRGMFASYGSASGQVEAFNIGLLAQKGSLFATRPTLFNYASDHASLSAMSKDLMEVVSSGKVDIAINARYPLEDARKAHQALEGRDTTGATVLLA